MLGKVLRIRHAPQRSAGSLRPISALTYLPRIDIFKGVPHEALDELGRSMAVRNCSVGTMFFTPEDASEHLFMLKAGTVELYRLNASGRRIALSRLSAGDIFGDIGLLGQTMHGCFAEAVEPSLVCVATREDLLRLLGQRPEVALRLLEAVGRRLKELEERFARLALNSVRVRLADFLLSRLDAETQQVTGLTHAEIGEMIGALRQTVTETLNAMANEGLIKVGHKRIRVTDNEGLRRIVEEAG